MKLKQKEKCNNDNINKNDSPNKKNSPNNMNNQNNANKKDFFTPPPSSPIKFCPSSDSAKARVGNCNPSICRDRLELCCCCPEVVSRHDLASLPGPFLRSADPFSSVGPRLDGARLRNFILIFESVRKKD